MHNAINSLYILYEYLLYYFPIHRDRCKTTGHLAKNIIFQIAFRHLQHINLFGLYLTNYCFPLSGDLRGRSSSLPAEDGRADADGHGPERGRTEFDRRVVAGQEDEGPGLRVHLQEGGLRQGGPRKDRLPAWLVKTFSLLRKFERWGSVKSEVK